MRELEKIPVTSPASIEVFHELLSHGPLARVEIARRLGLSQAAVTKAIAPLSEAGYVQEADETDAKTSVGAEKAEGDHSPVKGRPVSPLEVVGERAYVIGIKITASRLFEVLTDISGQILWTYECDFSSHSVEDALDRIEACTSQARCWAKKHGISEITGVGLAISGDISRTDGEVRNSPLLGWTHIDICQLLSQRIGLPVCVENDVRALTCAERLFGEGKESNSWAIVTLGEGIGCGLFLNGAVLAGAYGVAGEIGHLPLASMESICSCGRRGCVESIASAPAICARMEHLTGKKWELCEVADAYEQGESHAQHVIGEADRAVASALATLTNLLGPEKIILSGESVSYVADSSTRLNNLQKMFRSQIFGAAAECELVLLTHTFVDWARGAAACVISEIARRPL